MYQSIPSLTTTAPGATPGDSHGFTITGVGFPPNFLCPGGRSLELEKFPAVLEGNAGTSRFVSKKPEQFEKQVFFVLFDVNFCKNSRCLLYL